MFTVCDVLKYFIFFGILTHWKMSHPCKMVAGAKMKFQILDHIM